MRLLFLTPQFPDPPHQGATLRNYNLIRWLARGHSLSLFSMLAPGDDPAASALTPLLQALVTAAQPARPPARRLADLLLRPLPDMALRLWDAGALAALRDHLHRCPPDLIQVEGIEMAPYLFALRAGGVPLPPVLYDAHNAETLLQRRAALADLRQPRRWPAALYSAIQTLKLARYERRVLRAVAAVTAVSQPDAAALRRLAPGCDPAILPNGVDLAAYDPTAPYPTPYPPDGAAQLLFTGKMDFRPNVDGVLWFVRRVLPLLHDQGLRPHFWIVGKNPHPRLHELRGRADVTLTGFVPDVRPYLAHADLYVAPLLAGGGTRLKIMEAMAMARPIIATRLAAEGFPVIDGEHLVLADDPPAFARGCQALLADRATAAAMAARGRAFVARDYDWPRLLPGLEQLHSQLARP